MATKTSGPEPLESVARLPQPGDNVAIAIRRLEAGMEVEVDGTPRRLNATVLEGHRFAVRPIAQGEFLLSWGQPFGQATAEIAPGQYVANQGMLDSLNMRKMDIVLPAEPNFVDFGAEAKLDAATFQPAPPTPRASPARQFQGYPRPGGRGIGTRNFIAVVGTSSLAASFARQLATRMRGMAKVFPGCDGVVAVAHTEGGGPEQPNNSLEVLRALAGFLVHPNVGAVLAVDAGGEPIDNARLKAFMEERGYPLQQVPHKFLSMGKGVASALAEGEAAIRSWLPQVAAQKREACPLSGLRIALQCGGSDAFSGISGNPLAGAVAHEVIRHGGSACLCETDEAVGAESYLLQKVKDLATARALLERVEGFKKRLSFHGASAEGNPSGGNRLRGLYNIFLKSLGATHKKDPRTRVDAVIDYAQPMTEPGFYFMNSPGNDLEGIAGQIGSGCNLIIFVTGNGSVTNFPFVPTLKITTTTRRHQLLINEMDVNAGRYLEGTSMEQLTAETFEQLIETISGKRTKGEHAGHAQVSLWRNWRQTDASQLERLRSRPAPEGKPMPLAAKAAAKFFLPTIEALRIPGGWATERVGLVFPMSLCSAQIALMAAERLQSKGVGRTAGVGRYVALTHTEGCGFAGGTMYETLERSYQGYAVHPNVAAALLLEHGCEKTPNDSLKRHFESVGLPLNRFGWVSVQLDGGIEKALGKVEGWFAEKLAALPAMAWEKTSLGSLNLSLLTAAPVTATTAKSLAMIARAVVEAGGSLLLAESDPLLANAAFRSDLIGEAAPKATIAYGEPLARPGLHIAATETDHWVENLTGLGASGTHLFLAVVSGHARQGHPLLPLVQVGEASERGKLPGDDVDGFLSGVIAADAAMLASLAAKVASRPFEARAMAEGQTDFQISRGLLGVST